MPKAGHTCISFRQNLFPFTYSWVVSGKTTLIFTVSRPRRSPCLSNSRVSHCLQQVPLILKKYVHVFRRYSHKLSYYTCENAVAETAMNSLKQEKEVWVRFFHRGERPRRGNCIKCKAHRIAQGVKVTESNNSFHFLQLQQYVGSGSLFLYLSLLSLSLSVCVCVRVVAPAK